MVDLTKASQVVFDPITALWKSFIMYLPGLLGALAMLIIGYAIGHLIGIIVTKILDAIKLDNWIKKLTKSNAIAGLTISKLAGELVKWWIFIAFLASAANFTNAALSLRYLSLVT